MASLLPDFATLTFFSLIFSSVSKSFNCNSRSIVSLSLTGSTELSTCTILSLSKQRNTCKIASVSLLY